MYGRIETTNSKAIQAMTWGGSGDDTLYGYEDNDMSKEEKEMTLLMATGNDT